MQKERELSHHILLLRFLLVLAISYPSLSPMVATAIARLPEAGAVAPVATQQPPDTSPDGVGSMQQKLYLPTVIGGIESTGDTEIQAVLDSTRSALKAGPYRELQSYQLVSAEGNTNQLEVAETLFIFWSKFARGFQDAGGIGDAVHVYGGSLRSISIVTDRSLARPFVQRTYDDQGAAIGLTISFNPLHLEQFTEVFDEALSVEPNFNAGTSTAMSKARHRAASIFMLEHLQSFNESAAGLGAFPAYADSNGAVVERPTPAQFREHLDGLIAAERQAIVPVMALDKQAELASDRLSGSYYDPRLFIATGMGPTIDSTTVEYFMDQLSKKIAIELVRYRDAGWMTEESFFAHAAQLRNGALAGEELRPMSDALEWYGYKLSPDTWLALIEVLNRDSYKNGDEWMYLRASGATARDGYWIFTPAFSINTSTGHVDMSGLESFDATRISNVGLSFDLTENGQKLYFYAPFPLPSQYPPATETSPGGRIAWKQSWPKYLQATDQFGNKRNFNWEQINAAEGVMLSVELELVFPNGYPRRFTTPLKPEKMPQSSAATVISETDLPWNEVPADGQ